VTGPISRDDLTQQLRRWRDGDSRAFDEVLPRVYDELRHLADARLRRERPDHTLSATALVHEAYLRLAAAGPVDWQNRAHFFAVASRAMRRILVDYAKERGALKRGGDLVRVAFEPEQLAALLVVDDPDPDALVALDGALARLEVEHPRHARAIELRYFGGLTLDEMGTVLEVSAPTAMRDLRFAQAWLARALVGGAPAG
jgi:RNA polymerase sigma factor (TIGR02999 family)